MTSSDRSGALPLGTSEPACPGADPKHEQIEIAAGGWMSGPSIDPDASPEDELRKDYGRNVALLAEDYTDFVIRADGRGFKAYTRGKRSRPIGPAIRGATLNQLAVAMNKVRRHMDGV